MLELKILSGKKAGCHWVARRFPVHIGRASDSDLQLDDPGIWNQHLLLNLKPGEGIVLSAQSEALVSVNGEPIQQARLRNGDQIQIGSTRLQLWLSPMRQTGLGLREWLTWASIAAVCLAQIAIIYWLLR